MYDDLVKRLRAQAEAEKFFEGEEMLYSQAADAIEELQKENKEILFRASQLESMYDSFTHWIPVTERLPDYDEKVLVTDFCGTLGWCMHVWYRTHDGKGTDYWEAEDGHFVGINYAEYWMPLPEPPMEE